MVEPFVNKRRLVPKGKGVHGILYRLITPTFIRVYTARDSMANFFRQTEWGQMQVLDL